MTSRQEEPADPLRGGRRLDLRPDRHLRRGQPEATPEYFQDAQSRTDWKMNIATPEQQSQILKLVAQGLDEGALGIGINAGYAPGYGRKEYYALAELAAERDVATFTHVRYASNMEPRARSRRSRS
jgi:N-acyl-D-glutamate deacylase